jgi:hypothetical protein
VDPIAADDDIDLFDAGAAEEWGGLVRGRGIEVL